MKKISFLIWTTIFLILVASVFVFAKKDNDKFITYIADTKKQEIKLYLKDDKNVNFSSIERLKIWLDSKQQQLVFAMNGGMYKPDKSPVGLYIENQVTFLSIDTTSKSGNFYLKPNGIFYITTDNVPAICNSTAFIDNGKIKYATQSGPMLVINGKIHPAFKEGSVNVNIRNGVGILPGNKVIFAMSKKEINFYDFAVYFKNMGCRDALYLDGTVSSTYLPEENWMQTDGNFGVIIGISEKKN